MKNNVSKTNQGAVNIAIDGNEANVSYRVGSNVYAHQILTALEKITRGTSHQVTVLLNSLPRADLPPFREGWEYRQIRPKLLWTQFAEPIHLFLHQDLFDVFFTPSHYAPRACPVPYISSIMDLAFLEYPDQYDRSDLVQLKYWTRSSVKHADRVVAISEFTRQDAVEKYGLDPDKLLVAQPSIDQIEPASSQEATDFFQRHQIRKPYFIYLGTLQPRKNLIRLVQAYEQFCRRVSGQQLGKAKGNNKLSQLVLAGKTGWLADPILERIHQSPFFDFIITPGFVPTNIKPHLYQQATASLSLGLYEGFGIPALESLAYDCLPIVANTTSLPEVAGPAGIQVEPTQTQAISQALEKVHRLTAKTKAAYLKKGHTQLNKFSWTRSAEKILAALIKLAHEK